MVSRPRDGLTTTPRQERFLRKLCVQLAAATAQTPAQVRAELEEAIGAGLLRLTRSGFQATIPGEADETGEDEQ